MPFSTKRGAHDSQTFLSTAVNGARCMKCMSEIGTGWCEAMHPSGFGLCGLRTTWSCKCGTYCDACREAIEGVTA